MALVARTESLKSTIGEAREVLNRINAAELTINRLERDIELARSNHRRYSETLEQARIQRELEQAKVSRLNLMQPPTFVETPASPRPIRTLALGFVLSLLAGVSAALVAHYLDSVACYIRLNRPVRITGAPSNPEPLPASVANASVVPTRTSVVPAHPR